MSTPVTARCGSPKNYGAEYHLIDEFRGSPSRINSGLSDRPQPLNLDGTPYTPELTALPDSDAKSDASGGDGDDQSDKATTDKPAGKGTTKAGKATTKATPKATTDSSSGDSSEKSAIEKAVGGRKKK